MTEVLTQFPIYLMMNLGRKTPCPLCIDASRLVLVFCLLLTFLLTLLLFLINLILYICYNKMGFKPNTVLRDL